MFSEGIIAQAADLMIRRGAAYHSSVGNQAHEPCKSVFREVIVFSFQWDQLSPEYAYA